MGVLDTLNAASPNRRSVTIVLDGALQAEHDRKRTELDDAIAKDERGEGASMADATPNTRRVLTELDEIRDRMAASQVTFIVEQMPWAKRIELAAEHPARDGEFADARRGFNVATFYPALIRASTVSVTDSTGETETEIPEATWVHLLGNDEKAGALPPAAVSKLTAAAMEVNEGTASVPPSARSWLEKLDSGTSSESPSPGPDQAPSDSTGGSPRTSPTGSTTPKKATKRTKKAPSSRAKATSPAGSGAP